MTEYVGQIHKMKVALTEPVSYHLTLSGEELMLNDWLGHSLTMRFTGKIACIACGRPTKKSFHQGHCYPCSQKLASCDRCIIKPELCHYHLGTCREPSWGEAHCFQPHIVYLANTSGLKIGITRQAQVPTRWIDQGAVQAVPLFQVQTRLHSGLLESYLKESLADKTNWRRMLQGEGEWLDLDAARAQWQEQVLAALPDILTDSEAQAAVVPLKTASTRIYYPVQSYPTKITSFNLDKCPSWTATLQGIKGQYLLTDQGVINLRKYAGYEIALKVRVNASNAKTPA